MHANTREEIAEVGAGDIVAAVGLKDDRTGDTLPMTTSPIILESINFPEPVISVAIEPKTKADQDKLGEALQRLARGGPDLPRPHRRGDRARPSSPGMGELHLEVIVDRLTREFKVEANVGQAAGGLPRDHRREPARPRAASSARPAAAASTATSSSSSSRCRARRRLSVRETRSSAASIPREYIPAVDAGIKEAIDDGRPRRLSRWSTCKATLIDGSYHDVDSSEMAFKIAGSMAFKDAVPQGATRSLLEPIMEVEVVTPEEFMGDVIGDLNAGAGRSRACDERGASAQVIRAIVPLAEMFGYATDAPLA